VGPLEPNRLLLNLRADLDDFRLLVFARVEASDYDKQFVM
jgi:hypothetical protein